MRGAINTICLENAMRWNELSEVRLDSFRINETEVGVTPYGVLIAGNGFVAPFLVLHEL